MKRLASRRPGSFLCCGVRIDAYSLEHAVDELLPPPEEGQGRAVHLCNAYTLSLARRDPSFGALLNEGDLNLVDGMPLAWIGRRLGFESLQGRVYGPDLMAMTLDRSRQAGLRHYLYGSTPAVVGDLNAQLRRRFPGVEIVGSESPPFRSLTDVEARQMVDRVRSVAPDVVWVGLGTPRQDIFVHQFRERLGCTLVSVGAAFDFLAGARPQAPPWMQQRGLEWAYRLVREPRRMWRRYLIGNAVFLRGLLSDRPTVLDHPADASR